MTTEIVLILVTALLSLISNIIISNKTRKANKFDIKYITEAVESVKSDFEKINSYNKSRIDYLFSNEREKKHDQKKAILEFWDEHFTLIRLCESQRYEIDEYRMPDFYSFRTKIESQEDKCDFVFSRLYFLMDDENTINIAESINHKVVLNSIKFIGYLNKIEPLLIKSKELIDQGEKDKYASLMNEIDSYTDTIDNQMDNNNVNAELDEFKKKYWSHHYPDEPKI